MNCEAKYPKKSDVGILANNSNAQDVLDLLNEARKKFKDTQIFIYISDDDVPIELTTEKLQVYLFLFPLEIHI